MAGSRATEGEALEIRRTFQAPARRVFAAWTSPEEVKRWAAPGPLTTPLAEVDLRAGGRYRIHMREPDGTEHRVHGVYREVDPPRRLVYTWSWEDDSQVVDSVVTVEINERGGATEVVLRHEALPTKERRDRHEEGWSGCMVKLESMLSPGR